MDTYLQQLEAVPQGLDAYVELAENLRINVRQLQRRLVAEPDPASPWWFLVDPDAE